MPEIEMIQKSWFRVSSRKQIEVSTKVVNLESPNGTMRYDVAVLTGKAWYSPDEHSVKVYKTRVFSSSEYGNSTTTFPLSGLSASRDRVLLVGRTSMGHVTKFVLHPHTDL